MAAPKRQRLPKDSSACRCATVPTETTLQEFDLDAALARKPAVMLVDELAHTNAPGSRHPKRWQDVEELLAAGIDVYTTLNVQHLESLNDIVGQITGIRVFETLPDKVFDEADEVALVDLPPDELIERLHEGKVYLPEQALRAADNFFRKGNLIALRELALRRTADRVDEQMRDYRDRRGHTRGVAGGRPAAGHGRPGFRCGAHRARRAPSRRGPRCRMDGAVRRNPCAPAPAAKPIATASSARCGSRSRSAARAWSSAAATWRPPCSSTRAPRT